MEVGCAEGHFTGLLAQRAKGVLACDISADAIKRAVVNCAAHPSVRFATLDVQDGLPQEKFDLVLYSDVLYYMSRNEVLRMLEDTARVLSAGSYLIFSNEWNTGYQYFLDPKEILTMTADSGQ